MSTIGAWLFLAAMIPVTLAVLLVRQLVSQLDIDDLAVMGVTGSMVWRIAAVFAAGWFWWAVISWAGWWIPTLGLVVAVVWVASKFRGIGWPIKP